MANTFVKIASVTVGSGGAASMAFSSIPGTYTDLCVLTSARTNRALGVDGISVNFNGSSANFSTRYLEGDGTSAISTTSTTFAGSASGNTATSNTFGNSLLYIPNYTSANFKSFSADGVGENNATLGLSDLIAGLWSNTAAITSITVLPTIGTSFNQYSTATLYGIKSS
jgi:hypothetical protein